jgi:hypothetical protein
MQQNCTVPTDPYPLLKHTALILTVMAALSEHSVNYVRSWDKKGVVELT